MLFIFYLFNRVFLGYSSRDRLKCSGSMFIERRRSNYLFMRNRGSVSLILLMVISVVIAITVAVYSGSILQQMYLSRFPGVHLSFRLSKSMILNLVNSDASWNRTVVSPQTWLNPDLRNCLDPQATCTLDPNTDYPMVLHDGVTTGWTCPTCWFRTAGMAIGNPAFGFTEKGTICWEFDKNNGSRTCTLSWEVTFRPLCPPAPTPCVAPRVAVKFKALYSPLVNTQRRLPLNLSSYDFTVVK